MQGFAAPAAPGVAEDNPQIGSMQIDQDLSQSGGKTRLYHRTGGSPRPAPATPLSP